jgi:hypothetical protein
MEDGKLLELVETELESLQLRVQIDQFCLAQIFRSPPAASPAKAKMSAPKISAMENELRNLTIGTLIRVAHALGSRVEIKLVRRKGAKLGRRNGGRKVKTSSL